MSTPLIRKNIAFILKAKRNAWRRAKYHGTQLCRLTDGTGWTWSFNYGEYNGTYATREAAREEAIKWFQRNRAYDSSSNG